MTVYENWQKMAYAEDGRADKRHWDKYLPLEQAVYEQLLATKTNVVEGTVSELAARFNMSEEYICGLIDGVNAALDTEIDVKSLTGDTEVRLSFDFERLYKKMVEYKATHLYNLPQWEQVLDSARRRDLFYEQKKSGTVIKDAKPGRNEPCPCGSGKKYKKCCGA